MHKIQMKQKLKMNCGKLHQVTNKNAKESHTCLAERERESHVECMFLVHVLQAILSEHQIHKLDQSELCTLFSLLRCAANNVFIDN